MLCHRHVSFDLSIAHTFRYSVFYLFILLCGVMLRNLSGLHSVSVRCATSSNFIFRKKIKKCAIERRKFHITGHCSWFSHSKSKKVLFFHIFVCCVLLFACCCFLHRNFTLLIIWCVAKISVCVQMHKNVLRFLCTISLHLFLACSLAGLTQPFLCPILSLFLSSSTCILFCIAINSSRILY